MVASTTATSYSDGARSKAAMASSVELVVATEWPNRSKYTLINLSNCRSSSIRRILTAFLFPARRYYRGMRFHTEYLTFKTANHRDYINITPQVESELRKSGIQDGMVLVSAMHITAGIWVNDAEDGLIADIDEWLEKLAPFRKDYRHHRTGETNGDSHLKSLLVHHEVIVPVTRGKLDFGPWQQVYYAEFDGRRAKRVIVKVMGE